MVVTGTMRHLAGNIIDLHVSSLEQPIGVTSTHPIWSETRQEFVPAAKLTDGEKLRTVTGVASRVERITSRNASSVDVYNLEVDAEHVYQVAAGGLLVHNSCPISMKMNAGAIQNGLTGQPSAGSL